MTTLHRALPIVGVLLVLFTLVSPVAAADPAPTAKVEPALLEAAHKSPKSTFSVIVMAERSKRGERAARHERVARRIADEGEKGKVNQRLALVDGVAAQVSGKKLLALARDPDVKAIAADRKVKLHAWPDAGAGSLKSVQTAVANAPAVWAQGNQGQGVAVAVLDSGVAPHPDLDNLVQGVDLVGAIDSRIDLGGHGTHVAGIIAGAGDLSLGQYKGVAPKARIVSVKVSTYQGEATYSSIIKGIQWAVANRKALNIRVLNLSLGAPAQSSYKEDPLAAAVEMAWFSGIVVVASAGNEGEKGPGSVSSPANDPYVIAVGAADQNGTAVTTDDSVPAWSSRGPSRFDGLARPDVVAGGRKVISLRIPGSELDRTLQDRVVGFAYARFSGTSMAAPVVSGVAALVLAANPSLTPNQVKHAIVATARPIAGAAREAQGAGQVDARAAVALARSGAVPSANANQRPSDIFARSIAPMVEGAPLVWRNGAWENGAWDNGAWENLAWESIDWANPTWTDVTWESLTGWENGSWENGSWDNGAWENGSWENGSWENGSWEGLQGRE